MTQPPAILVVEDNPITRKTVAVALKSEGYRVLEAHDGKSAIEMVTKKQPHLILQDLVLPDMDGSELVKKLRSLPGGASIPILAFSGFLAKLDQARSLLAHFTDYLFKPVDPARLLETIEAHLAAARPGEQAPELRRRILAANDDAVQLRLLKVRLEKAGFTVSTAVDGAAALDLAKQSPPDAIVSDVMMPRLDGFKLCSAIRQDPALAGLPVVLLSAAHTEKADQKLARSVGANALVSAKAGFQEVIQALQTNLETPASAPVAHPADLSEQYSDRLRRQLERQVDLNAKLAHRLALREAELTIVAGLAETLENNAPVKTLVDELLHRCLDAAGVSKGAVYLIDPDGRILLRAQLGYRQEAVGALAEYFGHAGLLRRVIETGVPLTVPSPAVAGNGATGLLKKAGARSMLIVPLVLGEERFGALMMASENRELDSDWAPFAKAVGSQIGQAIRLAGAHSRLRDNEEHLSRIVHTLAEGLLITDREGRFTLANTAAEAILGVPVAEILKRSSSDATWKISTVTGEPFRETSHPCLQVLRTGEPLNGIEMVIERPDGSRAAVSVNSAPLRDASGAITGSVTSLSDITERRRQTEKLARSNAELEEFSYVVAHDLKEPLRTVAGFTQLLAQRYKGRLDAAADQFIDRAVSGAVRMQQLIDDLLAYSRLGSQQIGAAPVRCETVFQNALANLHAAIEASGAEVLHDPLPEVTGDALELSQLFQNLIGNALKFHGQEPLHVQVSAERKDDEWLVSVRDNGIGIDAQHTRRIFQVFQRLHSRTAYPGSCIGLAICKKIVERHGGRIWVESEPGKGATFLFTLPAAPAAPLAKH